MGLFSFTQEIAMDLGTANTIIITNGKIVVDEPSVVALDRRTDKMIAVGEKAKLMHEKTHENIRTIRPLRDGVIADFYACEQMMRGLIKQVNTRNHLFSPSLRMVIGVPSGSTEVELRAVRDSAEHAGGRDVYLIFEPMAAAIGIGIDVEAPEGLTVIKVKDTRYALAMTSAAYFGYPAEKLKVIGITGTKGKTTTTYMVKSILEEVGIRVGLIGTIEAIIGDKSIPANNTTPESYTIQKYFAEMVEAGCECVVMEVSSQGLKLDRTAGIPFEIGIFTNLGEDHIGPNEHKDFDEYKYCKSLLFKQSKIGIGNVDDKWFKDIFKDATCEVETFGFSDKADIRATDVKHISRPGYLGVQYHVAGLMDFDVEIDIPGDFSVYNSLTAIAVCRHFGVPVEDIKKALKVARVKGRIEMIKVSDDFTLMIDYAHNAMALESLLDTLRDYHPERIVTVFGCGGNRSKTRRYEMGEVSGKLSDFTIITSDNPRFEEPQAIIDDIVVGMKKTDGKYITICDRKEAIKYAIEHGRPGDVIILAGKGHETYQEIKGVKYDMDERVLIKEVLEELKK